MNDEKKIWLVSTDHLEEGLWFREEEDFKVGMNYVAVQVSQSGVTILAFILMSNHVHFILSCMGPGLMSLNSYTDSRCAIPVICSGNMVCMSSFAVMVWMPRRFRRKIGRNLWNVPSPMFK